MDLIDNKYRVLRTLGKGGCGIVYVCWSEALSKEVAVKVLYDRMHSNVSLTRFRNEAQSLTLCKHPCIVQCLNFGISQEGNPYFVMDYAPGVSLSEELKQNGPLSPSRFATIFQDVLSALECAHEAGLIHRDIKPSNILITKTSKNERAVLIDFGLTKQLEGQKLTATSSLLGTPQYMSPEQCQGKPLDIRSDLYSLGCTMYEAATGRPLYNGDAMEILLAHVQSEPQGIPTALAPLLNRLLDKDRDRRFTNATEASAVLAGINLAKTVDFKDTIKPQHKGLSNALKQKRLPIMLLSAALISILMFGAESVRDFVEETINLDVAFEKALERNQDKARSLKARYINEVPTSVLKAHNLQKLAMAEFKSNGNAPSTESLASCEASIKALIELKLEDSPEISKPMSLKFQFQRALGLRLPKDIEALKHAIAVAKRWHKDGMYEAHFRLEMARQLWEAQKFEAADEAYESAIKLMFSKYTVPDLSYLQILFEHLRVKESRGIKRESLHAMADNVSLQFESLRKTGIKAWACEYNANRIALKNSKDKAQSNMVNERMQRAAQDKNLAPSERALAWVMAGSAALAEGDKSGAFALLRTAKDNDLRDGQPPYTVAALAIHTMIDTNLTTSPQERFDLALLVYKNLASFREAKPGEFAQSAVYLANAARTMGQHQQAAIYYGEASDAALKHANANYPLNLAEADAYYGVSIDGRLGIARCSLDTGDYAGALQAKELCLPLLKRMTEANQARYGKSIEELSKELASKAPLAK